MNIMELGAIGELVGGVAVIASLVYVGLQVHQNTLATRYQTTQNLITANSEANFLLSGNTEIAGLHHRGSLDPDSLSDAELLQYNTFYFAYYNHIDFAYHQYKRGQLDETMWRKMDFEMPLYLSTLPGLKAWWEKDKARMSPEFVTHVEQRIASFDKPEAVPTFGRM